MRHSFKKIFCVIVFTVTLEGCGTAQTAVVAQGGTIHAPSGTGKYAERTPPLRPLSHLPPPAQQTHTINDPDVRELLQKFNSSNLIKLEHAGELFRIYRDNCHEIPCTSFSMTGEQQEHMKFVISAADSESDSNRLLLAELSAKLIILSSRMDSITLTEILYKIELLRKELDGASQISHDAGLMLYGPPGR